PLRVLELLPLRRQLALGRRESVAHGADSELPLEQSVTQAGGVGPRVAPRAVAQELLQSRFQTVEHGRTRPGIDDSSGMARSLRARAGRRKTAEAVGKSNGRTPAGDRQASGASG